MKKKLLLILLTSFCLFQTGCATYIKVYQQKPSEINIGNAKNISVGEFSISGNVHLAENKSLASIAAQALVDIAYEKMGSKNTHGERNYIGSDISDQLYLKLNNNGYFKSVKKNYNNFSNSVNNTDAVINGFVNYDIRDHVDLVDDITVKNGITIKNKKFKIKREIETKLSYQIINLSNGRVIVSRTDSDYDSDIAEGETQEQAIRRLRDWYYVVDSHLNRMTDRIVRKITPYYEFVSIEVKDGKSYAMKQGLEYAKKGLWEEAKKNWDMIVSNSGSDRDDYIFAIYNLGIYHEVKGELDEAGKYFDDCYKKSGKSECINARARIENRKIEVQRLKENNG